jgi:hypothetical protein
LYKTVIILYIVVFCTYILFSRQPDYFDGEITTATIHWQNDSIQHQAIPKAVFTIGKDVYAFDARYILRGLAENKIVNIIYEASNPNKAAVYSWWGYWIRAGELAASIILLLVLLRIAIVLNKNPAAESLKEQMEYKPEKKKRYNS